MEPTTDVLTGLMALVPTLLGLWGRLALLGVPLCLFLASAMLPFVVIFGLVLARFGRKKLYERSARQLAGLANLLNWIFLGSATVGFFVARPQLEAEPYLLGAYLLLGLLTAGTLLWSVVATAWKPLRTFPVVHGLLALVAGSCLAAVPLGGLLGAQIVLQGLVIPAQSDWQTLAALAALLLPSVADWPFWLLAGWTHFLEAAAAGGVGLLWLLFRRRVDDFGRDYYVFAANWCGEWGVYGGWIACLMAAGVLWLGWTRGILPAGNPATLVLSLGILIPLLVAAILWTSIARSTTPMRHKISMVFALLLYIAALASGGVLIVM